MAFGSAHQLSQQHACTHLLLPVANVDVPRHVSAYKMPISTSCNLSGRAPHGAFEFCMASSTVQGLTRACLRSFEHLQLSFSPSPLFGCAHARQRANSMHNACCDDSSQCMHQLDCKTTLRKDRVNQKILLSSNMVWYNTRAWLPLCSSGAGRENRKHD